MTSEVRESSERFKVIRFTLKVFSLVRILSSAIWLPHFDFIIRIFPSAIRHPPSAAIRSALYRDPDETRWPLAQNNNKPVEVLHLERESDEKSVHLQVLQILHILFHRCKFWDWNKYLSSQVLNSTSEYMNQKRQVFGFLIQGALRELISHDSLSNLLKSQ